MNIFKVLNKNNLINKKAELLIKNIINDKSNIDNDFNTYYKVWLLLKNLWNSINSPLFKFIKSDNTLISKDYKSMISNAMVDINILSTECELLENTVNNAFKHIEIERTMFNNDVKHLNTAINEFKNKNDFINKAVFEEQFYKNNNNSTSEYLAKVNINEGYLSLKNKNYMNVIASNIEIDKKSNGFPGNTHVADIIDGDLRFVGENNIHKNLKEILNSNMDTWFEYELFKVDESVYNTCNGYGFNYKEGDMWTTQDEKLFLSLKLTVNNTCNFIAIAPYVLENKDALPCILQNIQLYNGNNLTKEYIINQYFDDKKIFIFEETNIDYIKINLIQSKAYDTKVGHIYYIKTDTLKQSIFDNQEDNERIEGILPSKTSLYGNASDLQASKELFYPISIDANTKGGIELINANRFVIGIKSIELAKYEFYPISEYVSELYNTNYPIKNISLETKEFIPVEFDTYNFYIKYFISLDNGESWYPILPKHKAYMVNDIDKLQFENLNPYYVYTINNDEALELRGSNLGYIDTVFNPTSLKLKIVLSRPEEEKYKYMSPVVYFYKLNIETEADFDEY